MPGSMSLRWQGGLSLVELITANAVMAMILVASTGVVFAANQAYSRWVNRVAVAGTGDWLGVALQSDTHRYPPCGADSLPDQLTLCLPGADPQPVAVRYLTVGSNPFDVIREEQPSGRRTMVAHRLLKRPGYEITCRISTVASGFVRVYGLRYLGDVADRANVMVYFRAPLARTCGAQDGD